eukprot:7087190-Prymnesium_polylepis.2
MIWFSDWRAITRAATSLDAEVPVVVAFSRAASIVATQSSTGVTVVFGHAAMDFGAEAADIRVLSRRSRLGTGPGRGAAGLASGRT